MDSPTTTVVVRVHVDAYGPVTIAEVQVDRVPP